MEDFFEQLKENSGVRLVYGTVTEAKPGYAKVKLPEEDIVTDWLPITYPRTMGDTYFFGEPKLDEHAACLMDKHCEEGVIIGFIYSDADKPNDEATGKKFRIDFEDGTYIEYDKDGHKLTASVQGEAELAATGNIFLTGDVTIQGKLQVQDDINSTGTITGQVDVKAGVAGSYVKLMTHQHVETGGTTNAPTPTP